MRKKSIYIVAPEGIEILALTHGEERNLTVAQIMKTRGPAEDDEDAGGDEEAADLE
jgi:large subunit ribosomal protein L25